MPTEDNKTYSFPFINDLLESPYYSTRNAIAQRKINAQRQAWNNAYEQYNMSPPQERAAAFPAIPQPSFEQAETIKQAEAERRARQREYIEFRKNAPLRQAYIESTFNPSAHNTRSGAKGIYQLTDAAIKDYARAKRLDASSLDPYNVADARDIRNWLMNESYNSHPIMNANNPNWKAEEAKKTAMYNWGRGNMSRFYSRHKNQYDFDNNLDWIYDAGIPEETRNYIRFYVLGEDVNDHLSNQSYLDSLASTSGGQGALITDSIKKEEEK